MSEQIDDGGMVPFEWPAFDLGQLDWWPMDRYSPEATLRPVVQDADGKTWLVEQDERGDWREFLDGELLSKVLPVRWAVPTAEIVQAFAFG